MKASEIKKMLIRSLDSDSDTGEFSRMLGDAGISYDFSNGFSDRVIQKITAGGARVISQSEFLRNMNFVFYRIALTGVAAIIILLISIFLMEGSLSLDSFLGLGDTYDESIICLLTGN